MSQPLARCLQHTRRSLHGLRHRALQSTPSIPVLVDLEPLDTLDPDSLASRPSTPPKYQAPLPTQQESPKQLQSIAHYHPNNHLFPSLSNPNCHILMHSALPQTYGLGQTLMHRFWSDRFSKHRRLNLYYPFASKDEWELGCFLELSGMSMQSIDEFLRLKAVSEGLHPSFKTAKELRHRCELLPPGPAWKSKPWKTSHPTKNSVILYYRDPVECLQSLLENPLLQDHISFHPMQVFKTAEKLMRIYGQWMTGEVAWSMQSSLPVGGTLLGVILSSDKTTLTSGTRNRCAHPLLISLANIDMDFSMKACNKAFKMTAILPIAQFIHHDSKIRRVLQSRLYHDCVGFVIKPLKDAARLGVMMLDPVGQLCWCFTPLTAVIVDTPEAALITGQHTLAQLEAVASQVHPDNIDQFFFTASNKFCLNGVYDLYWKDWNLTDPSIFITPEPLHHFHKAFWDHDVKWCICVVGAEELDFRFSILQPEVGFRHFDEGISKVKQVTGREHQEIQRSLISVISGAVSKDFQTALHALMDIRYRSQAEIITSEGMAAIKDALACFHQHKQSIIDSGGRVGKNGVIDNFWIPKIEFLQSVVPCIQLNGVLMQFTVDVTERYHIEFLKDPAEGTNNRKYESQICRNLNRAEKCQLFRVAIAMEEAKVDFSLNKVEIREGEEGNENMVTTSAQLEDIIGRISGSSQPITDYFAKAQLDKYQHLACPQVFTDSSCVAFHLTDCPAYGQMLVAKAVKAFHIPDLHGALCDYLIQATKDPHSGLSISGPRLSSSKSVLPGVQKLEIWSKVGIQHKSFHLGKVLEMRTIFADGPSPDWPAGRHDAAVMNIDGKSQWPQSGLTGHSIVNVCLIFRAVPKHRTQLAGGDRFLAYVQRYDRVPQHNPAFAGPTRPAHGPYPEFTSGSYILKLAKRADGTTFGDVVPLKQLRALASLIPRFGKKADAHLTSTTSKEYSNEFSLSQFFYKDFYYALDSQSTVW